MATSSWIVLGVVVLLFVLMLTVEFKLESDEYYYNCYKSMEYRNKSHGFKCRGVDENRCKKCIYYKQYHRKQKGNRQ